MKKFYSTVEQVFTIISLTFYTGGPLVVILSGGLSEGEVSVATVDFALVRKCFQVIYVITFLLLLPLWKKALSLAIKDSAIIVLIGIILLSISWSTVPDIAFGRSVAMVGTTLFGVYFAARYPLSSQLRILGWVFGLIAILSVVFVVLLPTYGVMTGVHAGSWRGIYVHKNGLGTMMTLGAIIYLILTAKYKKRVLLACLALLLFLLVMSRSTSPLINLCVSACIFYSLKVLNLHYKLKVAALCIVSVTAYFLSLYVIHKAEDLLGIFGKDLTLTGRTRLWMFAVDLIEQRPLLGHGFGSLWSKNSESIYVWRMLGWTPPSAHNGFLDLWLAIGIVGLIVFSIHLLLNLSRALILVGSSGKLEDYLPFMLIFLMILVNLTESALLDRNNIYWVLYVSFSLSMRKNMALPSLNNSMIKTHPKL